MWFDVLAGMLTGARRSRSPRLGTITRMEDVLVVVGGSRSQSSLVEVARQRGVRTCVVDGVATAPLLEEADSGIVCDFQDVDEVMRQLRARSLRPIGAVTMGSDAAVVPTAKLCAVFDLPGLRPAAAEAAHDKRTMHAAFAAAVEPVPHATGTVVGSFDELAGGFAAAGGAIVVKPVDGSGQRGVSRIDDATQVEAAWISASSASRRGAVLWERLLLGEEYTFNGFVVAGAWHPVTLTRRPTWPAPPMGVARAHQWPSGLSVEDETAAWEAARRAAVAVGITDGPAYGQLRMHEGAATVIEIGARLGGGKDAELATLVTGIDLVPAVIDAALGRLDSALLTARPTDHAVGEVLFFRGHPGEVLELDLTEARQLPGVQDAGCYYREGMAYPPFDNGAGRLGYVIVTAADATELAARSQAAEAAIVARTSGGHGLLRPGAPGVGIDPARVGGIHGVAVAR